MASGALCDGLVPQLRPLPGTQVFGSLLALGYGVGEQNDDEAPLLDLGSDATDGGRHQGAVRAGQDP